MLNKIVFENAVFHDCYIHGFNFKSVEELYLGQEELLIDIDYILNWPNCIGDHVQDNYFNISRALLNFKNIENVKIRITENARFIDRIEKTSSAVLASTSTESIKSKWVIYSYTGEVIIELDASDMFVELIGEIHAIKNRQFLTSKERG